MEFHIRKAVPGDLDDIMGLVASSVGKMRACGNWSQWSETYPDKSIIANDIQEGTCYVILDGSEAVGSFVFKPGPDPTYDEIYEGRWLDGRSPYHVVHRLTSSPHAHGLFGTMLEFCGKLTRNMRVDTHRDNVIMRHLLEKHGFTYCGIIHIENGDERLAYQKCGEIRD